MTDIKILPKLEVKIKKLSFLENYILSGLAAAIAKTAVQPIERVHLIMITNANGLLFKKGFSNEKYKGFFDCALKTFSEHGILSFWRGNCISILRYFPSQALNFAFKEKIKYQFKDNKGDSDLNKLGKNIFSGGVAGTLTLIITYYFEYAKHKKQIIINSKKVVQQQFNGLDLLKTYKKKLAEVYKGFVIFSVGVFVYRGLYFGLYDTLKFILLNSDSSFPFSFALGYCVTVFSSFIAYPFDIIRRRMMLNSLGKDKYVGSFDCAIQIFKSEGIKIFMKGAAFNFYRGFGGAGVLSGFDFIVQKYAGNKVGSTSE